MCGLGSRAVSKVRTHTLTRFTTQHTHKHFLSLSFFRSLPESALDQYNYYLDTQRLRIAVSNMKNANAKEELEELKVKVLQHLSQLPAVPSAQMAYRPPLRERGDLPEEEMDVRGGGQVHEEHRR
jgi:histone deacetylase 1/2